MFNIYSAYNDNFSISFKIFTYLLKNISISYLYKNHKIDSHFVLNK